MPIFTKNAQIKDDEDIEEQINTFEITFMCSHSDSSKRALMFIWCGAGWTRFVQTEMNLLKVSSTYDYEVRYILLTSTPPLELFYKVRAATSGISSGERAWYPFE